MTDAGGLSQNDTPPPLPDPVPYPAGEHTDAVPKWSAAKSVWGGITAFVLAFAGALQIAVASGANLDDWHVWLNVFLVALTGGAGTSGIVYSTSNKVVYR